MSRPRPIPVIIFGAGRVSRAFLEQLAATQASLSQRYGVLLSPVALADSSGAIFDRAGLVAALGSALNAKQNGEPLGEQPGALSGITALDLVEHANTHQIAGAIVVDATAAEEMEPVLHRSLDLGYGVVLANKRPLAGEWTGAQRFFETSYVRFEASVGAGLPITTTLRYLVDTGDEVRYIEGALSRTLGYICTRLEDGEAFSVAVEMARTKGFTEPHPRDDLGGMDVARKALILARLAGWPLELAHIRVDPLYPAAMADLDADAFMAGLPRLNAEFAAYMGAITGVPRYIAEVRPEGGMVGLRMVGKRLAAQLRGPVNQVTFTTRRYAELPLTLSGPGDGTDVSAAAILQDCIQLAQRLAQD